MYYATVTRREQHIASVVNPEYGVLMMNLGKITRTGDTIKTYYCMKDSSGNLIPTEEYDEYTIE